MSYYYEAVVVKAVLPDLLRILEAPLGEDDCDCLAPIDLSVHRVTEEILVVFGWRAGADRPEAAEEMEDLACMVGSAVAIHYNDQVGWKEAALARDGDIVRYFGEADEIWVPYRHESTELNAAGPRYPGNAVPEDVECDCIWTGIDAALEAFGVPGQITASKIFDILTSPEIAPLWKRSGVSG